MASRTLSPDKLRDRVRILLDAQARGRAAVAKATAAAIDAEWARLLDPYNPADQRAFADATATTIRSARRRTNDLTSTFLSKVFDAYELPTPRGNPTAVDEPRGIPVETEMLRVPAQYRYDISRGKTPDVAREAAGLRAGLIADTDLTLAMRDVASQVLAKSTTVTGYRRVIHPELSTTGVCALCIVAAHRTYRKAELLPIHARCKCDVIPIFLGFPDEGKSVNDEDLAAVYAAVGTNVARKLKETRFVVQTHGELGPLLADAADEFRGPDDVRGKRKTFAQPKTP